jgi:hypothetical protein
VNKEKNGEGLARYNWRGIIINSGDTAALKRHRKIRREQIKIRSLLRGLPGFGRMPEFPGLRRERL